MKTTRSTIYLGIVLLSLALLIIMLVIPVLAKGIIDPTQPEKLDLRPIPIPVPSPPLATNQPSILATSSMSLLAMGPLPQPISVPTPPVSATQTTPSLAENQMTQSSTVRVQIANRQEIISMGMMFVVLLIWMWLHRIPSFHSLHQENA